VLDGNTTQQLNQVHNKLTYTCTPVTLFLQHM